MYYNDRRTPERPQPRPVTEQVPQPRPTAEATPQDATGMRVTPNINPASPLSPTFPGTAPSVGLPTTMQGPPTITAVDYIPGYLRTQIGRNVRAEFIIGTNQYVDKTGRLLEVGVNYFILEDLLTHDHVMCDLYSVKFVTTTT